MRVTRVTRSLVFVPLAAAIISTILFGVQGGFGGGHSALDFVIVILGLPFILFIPLVREPLAIPDLLLVIWIPGLLNMLGWFLLASILERRRPI